MENSHNADLSMKEILSAKAKNIEEKIYTYLPTGDVPQATIYRAMEYSLRAGGKRLRPILMTETAEMCGGNADTVIPFAAAMEMIHTYSLIHDDLPCMDNDDLRRGKPTNHKVFGEGMAVLAGDALLNKAFEITSACTDIAPEKVLRAINMLAVSSGTEGMIGGQVIDIESEGKPITLDELRYLHSLKTGAIIRSACTIGALLGGGSEEDIAACDEYALNLGIAFQICDDILDVVGDEEKLGKPVGSDEASGKNTYVSLIGLDRSKELAAEFTEKAVNALAGFGERAQFLQQLAYTLVTRNF